MTDPSGPQRAYADAAQLFQNGRLAEAEARIIPWVERDVPDPQLHALAGFIRLRTGNAAGAARALARARSLNMAEPVFALALGDALLEDNQPIEAEAAYRAALSLDPSRLPAVKGLALALFSQSRVEAGLSLFSDRVRAGERDHGFLAAYADLQTLAGQQEAAVETYRLAARIHARSGVAFHNLAAHLGDMGRFEEADEAIRTAMRLGLTGAGTLVIHARVLQGLGQMHEAEAMFREVLKLSPTSIDPNRELAQLVWMRTGDLAAASENLRHAIALAPDDQLLRMTLAKLHQFGGDPAGARRILDDAVASASHPQTLLLVHAADIALANGDPDASLALAKRAQAQSPQDVRTLITLSDACLATGDARQAATLSEFILTLAPDYQAAVARLATAWRMLDDPRYKALYDYETYVRPYEIDTPEGWSSLSAYLADLSAALVAAHSYSTHPFDQSLRHGSQTTQNLQQSKDPAIQAFFRAIDGPIRRHIAHLKSDATGMGRRARDDYELSGAWSVYLRPTGFHVDHIHPMGWLSSAFYVETPHAPPEDPHAGWIKFGQPGNPTRPELPAEHFVQPKPGTLVLFPSYMWHGTVPFTSDERRITIAFDVRPKG